MNKGLLIVVAKQWYSDHNTLHLPMWEMTVTPKDLYRIVWILTIGDLVYYDQTTNGAVFKDLFGDENIGDDSVLWF